MIPGGEKPPKPLTLLCVSDAHADAGGAAFFEEVVVARKPDVVVIAGDLTHHGPLEYARRMVSAAKAAGAQVVAVGGNMDPPAVHDWLDSEGIGIHGRVKEIGGYRFAGIGGSAPTPFDTEVEYSEFELELVANTLHLGDDPRRTILVSHSPPFGTRADVVKTGAHVGSTAVRAAIERFQPLACICGHIHEASGVDEIGETKVFKVPPLAWSEALLVKLPSLEIELVDRR